MKKTGKVREICQSEKVGTMILIAQIIIETDEKKNIKKNEAQNINRSFP